MCKKHTLLCWALGLVLLLSACSKVPEGIIPQKKMENILYDCYIGEGMSETELTQLYNPTDARKQYLFSVLKKYDVSKAEYDSSLNWYMQNLKIYMKMYDHVIVRLKKEQKKIQLEQGNTAQQGTIATGDTVNVWLKSRSAMLNELPAFSHYFAEIKANEGFTQGDLFKFSADIRAFNVSTGQLPKMVLTIVYANDSTQTVSRKIGQSTHLEIALTTSPNQRVDKIIAGFSQNRPGILMVDSIALMRIHVKAKPDTTKPVTKPAALK